MYKKENLSEKSLVKILGKRDLTDNIYNDKYTLISAKTVVVDSIIIWFNIVNEDFKTNVVEKIRYSVRYEYGTLIYVRGNY